MKREQVVALISLIAVFIIVSMLIGEFPQSDHKNQLILSDAEKAWLTNHNTLVYAADNNAPPLRFVDEADQQYKGVVVDYINLLSLQLGVNIEVHPLLWEDALISLAEGRSDMCDMFKSEERSESYLFTNPIYNLRAVVVVSDQVKSIEGINQLTFATQEGDYVNEYLHNEYPDIRIVNVPDVSSAIDLLLAGEVDAIAGDEPVVLYQLKNKEAESELHIIEEPLYENEVVFAIPKEQKMLLLILNKGITAIKSSDQLERIQQKWFGISTPIVQMPDYSKTVKYIFVLVSIFLLVVVGMITWNQSLKKEVNKRTKEVMNGKNDLQITFDGMTEYIAVNDLDLNVVNINQSYLDFIGKSKEEVIQKPCKDIFSKFDTNDLELMIHALIENEESEVKEMSRDNRHYIVRTYPLKNTNGELKNVLVIIQNVTKEKVSERQFLQESKMAAIGQLAAGMAHEIRNPLGIIRNQSFILESRIKDERMSRSFSLVNSSVDRASRIIDNLLEFSRLTDDIKRWINLKEFLSKILSLENKTMLKRNITCDLVCDSDLKIYSNVESLKHILINLISNAIDAVDSNGSVDIVVYGNAEGVVISVEDSGQGIHEDELEKIFNPFYTTKEPGKGTGLGLYIAYNEVQKLNGNITVERSEEEKTVFKVELPIKEELV